MKQFAYFIKGMIVGISNIIPGLCSGLVAIILNIYDLYLYVFGNIFLHPFKVIKKAFFFILGVIVGLLIAVTTITQLMEWFPLTFMFLFVGLLVGSTKEVYRKNLSEHQYSVGDIFIVFLSCAILLSTLFIKTNDVNAIDVNFSTFFIMIVLGVLISVAMILPGISGSLLLMSLGYYVFIIDNLSLIITSIINLSFDNEFFKSVCFISLFMIGCIIGFINISKGVKLVMEKYHQKCYLIVLSMMITSIPVVIFKMIELYQDNITLNPLNIIISILFLFTGYIISGVMPSKKC